MNKRQIIYSIFVALVLTLLSIFFFDQPIAAFVQKVGGMSSVVLQQGTAFLDVISGFPIARFALSYALLAAGLMLFAWKSTRAAAWMLLFIGCAQFVTRITAGTLKNVFHRLRPFEVIGAGNWDWKFFGAEGNSFPSGHAAHWWGLFFPLAFLFPRYRLPLLIIPLFISVARVGVNDHWCSDVLGSAAIAAAITLLFIWLFRRKERTVNVAPDPKRTSPESLN
ncbi:MAG TPA: phosphatase PAP2 family protein [Chthoniobacterales bacterium]|nr:phosphatase PAP2 family protein [Chthoniobacterales bacterium]